MEQSFTNRALGVSGDANTTSVTVRLPDEVVAYMDSHRNGRIKNRSEFLQHWAQVGMRVSMSDDLTEALDWALDQPVQRLTVDLADYGSVTIGSTALAGDPVEVHHFEVPQLTREDLESAIPVPEGSVVVVNEEGGRLVAPPDPGDELQALREAQVEALRSRVR